MTQSSQKGFAVIPLIIVLAVLAVGGYYGYYWLKLWFGIPPTPSVTEIPKTTLKKPTADWKTYRNEKYGFEVKYPEDWKIIGDSGAEVGFASGKRIQATLENDKNCRDNDNNTICAPEFLNYDVLVNFYKEPLSIGQMKLINGISWNRSVDEGLYTFVNYDTRSNDNTIVFNTIDSGEDQLLKILVTFKFLK